MANDMAQSALHRCRADLVFGVILRQWHIARPCLHNAKQGDDHVKPARRVDANQISGPHPLFGQTQRQHRRSGIQITVADHLRPAAECGCIRIFFDDLGKLPDHGFFTGLIMQRCQSPA